MLKAILLGNKIRTKKKLLDDLKAKDEDFEKREKELEAAVDEMTEETSDEDRQTIEDEVDQFEKDKEDHEKSKKILKKKSQGWRKNWMPSKMARIQHRHQQDQQKERTGIEAI